MRYFKFIFRLLLSSTCIALPSQSRASRCCLCLPFSFSLCVSFVGIPPCTTRRAEEVALLTLHYLKPEPTLTVLLLNWMPGKPTMPLSFYFVVPTHQRPVKSFVIANEASLASASVLQHCPALSTCMSAGPPSQQYERTPDCSSAFSIQ